MISILTFDRPRPDTLGRFIAQPVFRTRSGLPLTAACLVANGVREQLAQLFGREIEAELVEPIVPDRNARAALFTDANVVCVRGSVADAFVVLRPGDARRMVRLAFGERESVAGDPFSEIERQTFERFLEALVPLCSAICGATVRGERASWADAHARCTSYFEVRLLAETPFAIGFGISREPADDIGRRVTLNDLREVTLDVRAEVARARLPLRDLGHLRVGMTIPLRHGPDDPARLLLGRRPMLDGVCGARDGRLVFAMTAAST